MTNPYSFRSVKPIAVHQSGIFNSMLSALEHGSTQSHFKNIASEFPLPKAPSQTAQDRQNLIAALKAQNKGHSHSGILGSILDNLAHDVIDTVKGIPGGIETLVKHPVASGKAIVKSYEDTYGNGWGHFKHTFEQHPLGPILDALTVVTGGAGALAKGGRAAGELGIISKESKLAKLGDTGYNVVRGPGAIQAGKGLSKESAVDLGTAKVIRTSSNPVTRFRQNLTHRMLQTVGGEKLEVARYGRRLAAEHSYMTAKRIFHSPYHVQQAARGALKNPYEHAAAYALGKFGEAASPKDYADRLRFNAIGEKVKPDPELLRLMEHPETNKLYNAAIAAHYAKTKNKILTARNMESHLAEADRELRNRVAGEGKGVSAEHAQEVRYRAVKTLHGLDDHTELAKEIQNRGGLEPIYLPDTMNLKPARGLGKFGGVTGASNPFPENKGILFEAGRLAANQDILGPKYLRAVRLAHMHDVHEGLVRAAVKVPVDQIGEWQAKGYIKVAGTNPGHIVANQTRFEQLMEKGSNEGQERNAIRHALFGEQHPTAGEKNVYMVPKQLADRVVREYHQTSKVVRAIRDKPLQVWKSLILGYSPRFVVNNVVGNTLMAALRFGGPVKGMKAMFRMALAHGGGQKVADMLNLTGIHGLSEEGMRELFPELKQTNFAQAEIPMGSESKVQRVLAGPGYHAVSAHENLFRSKLAAAAAREEPEVRRILSKISSDRHRKHGKFKDVVPQDDLTIAIREAIKSKPGLREKIVNSVDDALGNYRDFTAKEEGIRKIVPFYSWYRHITRTSAKMISDKPGITDALANVGALGAAQNQSILGDVQDYLRSYTPIGKAHNGHVEGLNTAQINPFNSMIDVARAGNSAIHGDAATSARDLGSMLNPFIGAAIEQMTHKSMLTGRQIKNGHHGGLIGNLLASVVDQLPQVKLAGDIHDTVAPKKLGLEDLYTHTGQLKKHQTPVLSKGLHTDLLSFLGAGLRDIDIKQAQESKKRADTANNVGGYFRAPTKRKPRKSKKNPYLQ